MNARDDIIRVLLSVGPHSCPNDINLHCHTLCSDGSLSPTDLILQACENKLSHLSITDHHTLNAYPAIDQWLKNNKHKYPDLPKVWSGIEISCLLSRCLVHVIGLGFDLYHKSLNPYISGEAPTGNYLEANIVVNSIHRAGGIVVLAHPARYRLPYNVLIDEASRLGFDAGEAWYDYEFQSLWKPTALICDCIDRKLKKLNMFSTCGTDTHGLILNSR